MSSVRFKLNVPGVKALLRSPEAQRAVNAAAADLAARAGDGFGVEARTTSRSRAYVRPVDAKGIKRNYKERVLERLSVGG